MNGNAMRSIHVHVWQPSVSDFPMKVFSGRRPWPKGRNRDTAWFAIIDSEWPAIRACYEAWLDDGNFNAEGRQIKSLSALTAPLLFRHDDGTCGRG